MANMHNAARPEPSLHVRDFGAPIDWMHVTRNPLAEICSQDNPTLSPFSLHLQRPKTSATCDSTALQSAVHGWHFSPTDDARQTCVAHVKLNGRVRAVRMSVLPSTSCGRTHGTPTLSFLHCTTFCICLIYLDHSPSKAHLVEDAQSATSRIRDLKPGERNIAQLRAV